MQQVGFMMCFILFVIPAFKFEYFRRPENIRGFQAMYFLSSCKYKFSSDYPTVIGVHGGVGGGGFNVGQSARESS